MKAYPHTQIVALARELDEAKEAACEVGVVEVLMSACRQLGAHAETLGLDLTLEHLQIEHTALTHEAGHRGEKADVLLELEVVDQHLKNEHELELTNIKCVFMPALFSSGTRCYNLLQ